MFSKLRPLLFKVDPEKAHTLAIKSLKFNLVPNVFDENKNDPIFQTKIFEKDLDNPIGMAAGFDKNAEVYNSLFKLGFGFVEVGTITPLKQYGNPKPRVFRLVEDEALINRLGFNNQGAEIVKERIKRNKKLGLLGINVGPNKDSSDRLNDYLIGLKTFYDDADYITINISSPNTEGLRDLFNKEYFSDLISSLKLKQIELSKTYMYVPLFLKISPNIDNNFLKQLVEVILEENIDGIICTNTSNIHNHPSGKGGISGKPLLELSTEILVTLRSLVGKDFPIIASGGVMDLADFQRKLDSGADLVQIYTGLIYKGPALIDRIINAD